MQLAESAESRDGKTNREIAKYLFVSPHRKRPRSPQFREFESQVSGQLASVAAGRRLDIARTGDAQRRSPCHPGQQICRFLEVVPCGQDRCEVVASRWPVRCRRYVVPASTEPVPVC